MSLARHASRYAGVGVVLYLIDWGIVVVLSHLGLWVAWANLIGRIVGALLGYWLNGMFTFAGDETEVGRKQLARYAVMWIATTLVSTWAMERIDTAFGLTWAWLAKPVIELMLGAVGFVLSRHWIYKA